MPGISHIDDARARAERCRKIRDRPPGTTSLDTSTSPATIPPKEPAMHNRVHARNIDRHFASASAIVGSTHGKMAAATHIAWWPTARRVSMYGFRAYRNPDSIASGKEL